MNHLHRTSERHRRSFAFAVLFGSAFLFAACGGSSDGDVSDASNGTQGAVEDTGAAQPATDEGSGTGTLTTDDGTVYELTMSTCDTSSTDPSGLPLDNGYNLTGRTADGAIALTLIRAGLSDEEAFFSGAFEGSFDSEGQNATMIYVADNESLAITVDGANVSGTVGSRAIAPTRPHGDSPMLSIDINC